MNIRKPLAAILLTLGFILIASPAHAAKLRLSGLGGLGAGMTDAENLEGKTGFGGIIRLGLSAALAPTMYAGAYFSHARSHVDEIDVGGDIGGINSITLSMQPSSIGAMFTLKLPSVALDLYAGYAFGSLVTTVDLGSIAVNGKSDLSGFQAGAFGGYDLSFTPQFSLQIGPSVQFSSVSISTESNSDVDSFSGVDGSATHLYFGLSVQGTFETIL